MLCQLNGLERAEREPIRTQTTMAEAMQTTTPTKAVARPKQANLLACRQWWKVCFLYGDQEKYYRQVYGRAASQRIALSDTEKNCNQTVNNNILVDATNNDTNENLLNTLECATNNNSGSKSYPNKAVLLFPHKNHKGILIKNNNSHRGQTLDPNSDVTQNNSRVTVLDDPFLLGSHATHDSKDSGINNIDDPPPPPLPAKSVTRMQRSVQQQQQMQSQQELMVPSQYQLNDGFDFNLLTYQLGNRQDHNAVHSQMNPQGGTVGCGLREVNHCQKWSNNNDTNIPNNGTTTVNGVDSKVQHMRWRNYGGDNSPSGTVHRPTRTSAGISFVDSPNHSVHANEGLCGQIDKILEHSLQNEM